MNVQLAQNALEAALRQGVSEFCICPGKRNAPLVALLSRNPEIKKYYWFEERSAAFFALGRSRATNRPVAVVTTSGTAAGELLPATMEAYYTGVPLLLMTADRPRHYRGTGAPQTAEQVGLLGRYVVYQEDLEEKEQSLLHVWDKIGPAHVNICFDEPLHTPEEVTFIQHPVIGSHRIPSPNSNLQQLERFLKEVRTPLVVVGELQHDERNAVVNFLQQLKFPVYLEAISGLREDPRLAPWRIKRSDGLWKAAQAADYPIDSILRLGGVPTFRLWRDLEDLKGKIKMCSLSSRPFRGLSWGELICGDLNSLLANPVASSSSGRGVSWLENDKHFTSKYVSLLESLPDSEASLVHQLSQRIANNSLVYLGNSLPIRYWDLAATDQNKGLQMYASRGVNGIDGQISTYLGLSNSDADNWAVIGDLTALYDMAGPWIISQLSPRNINIAVVNNSGGQIFARMFKEREFLHEHDLNFKPLADMWRLDYHLYTQMPDELPLQLDNRPRLIEIVPNPKATEQYWHELAKL